MESIDVDLTISEVRLVDSPAAPASNPFSLADDIAAPQPPSWFSASVDVELGRVPKQKRDDDDDNYVDSWSDLARPQKARRANGAVSAASRHSSVPLAPIGPLVARDSPVPAANVSANESLFGPDPSVQLALPLLTQPTASLNGSGHATREKSLTPLEPYSQSVIASLVNGVPTTHQAPNYNQLLRVEPASSDQSPLLTQRTSNPTASPARSRSAAGAGSTGPDSLHHSPVVEDLGSDSDSGSDGDSVIAAIVEPKRPETTAEARSAGARSAVTQPATLDSVWSQPPNPPGRKSTKSRGPGRKRQPATGGRKSTSGSSSRTSGITTAVASKPASWRASSTASAFRCRSTVASGGRGRKRKGRPARSSRQQASTSQSDLGSEFTTLPVVVPKTNRSSKRAAATKLDKPDKPEKPEKPIPEDEYEVESIIDDIIDVTTLEHLYLVKWKGFDAESNTWEPQRNLKHCLNLKQAYDARRKSKKRKA